MYRSSRIKFVYLKDSESNVGQWYHISIKMEQWGAKVNPAAPSKETLEFSSSVSDIQKLDFIMQTCVMH